MSYYFSKTLTGNFQDTKNRVMVALKEEGFGVLSEINIKDTLKQKLDVDFQPYVILGARNPPLAYEALKAEAKIGTMLPCNVIIREVHEGSVEVSAVDPVASMQAVENDRLGGIAKEVREKLKRVVESL